MDSITDALWYCSIEEVVIPAIEHAKRTQRILVDSILVNAGKIPENAE